MDWFQWDHVLKLLHSVSLWPLCPVSPVRHVSTSVQCTVPPLQYLLCPLCPQYFLCPSCPLCPLCPLAHRPASRDCFSFIGKSQALPTTSYPKMIDIWLIATMMVPFLEISLHRCNHPLTSSTWRKKLIQLCILSSYRCSLRYQLLDSNNGKFM